MRKNRGAIRTSHSTQLSLFEGLESASTGLRTDFRTIHYLGSKLRLLPVIRGAVAENVPPGKRVLDLFAGSGAVSLGLGDEWDITSVDIQEYSRVICNGLLNPPEDGVDIGRRIEERASTGEFREGLRVALAGLLAFEREALVSATAGKPDDLFLVVENGSLLKAARKGTTQPKTELDVLMRVAWDGLRTHGLDTGPETVITRYYGGLYFSWEQAIDLDSLLSVIHQQTDRATRDHLLAAVFAVASDIVNTVGKHFAQPIRPVDSHGRPKWHLVNQTIRDRSINVYERFAERLTQFSGFVWSARQHRAIRGDFEAVLANEDVHFDAVYADPPYTRDHYSRYYHVLETMALHDEPQVSTTTIRAKGAPRLTRGLYRSARHQSPFCIKTQAPSAFDTLFRGIKKRGVPLILSYSPYRERTGNRPRLLTVDELTSLAKRHFQVVNCEFVGGVSHHKFNLSERNVVVDYPAEILLVCEP